MSAPVPSPAPWGSGLPGSNPMTVFDTHGRRVAEVYDDADRALMRSAPDLLAALREMVECEDAAENHPEGWEALFERFAYALADARAALAKAEGRKA